MIDQLIAALSKEVEMSAEEIADTIWLALQMQEFQTESVSSSSSPEEKEINKQESQLDSETSPKTTPNTSDFEKTSAQLPTEQKAGVYPKSQQKTSESLDLSFKVPDAPSLREPLTLARALKPLMRRIPSGRELVLDEAATIQQIADEKLWTPILKPTLEPWLDLELVVDEAISMQIWRHTIRELERLLKNYGIFRDVRVWGLVTNENEQVQIRRGVGATAKNEAPRSAKELIDPSGRRLILVVSDCISSFWRNGKVTPVLELWAKQGSMAIVQMLPKWLWKRTALGRASEVRLRGLTPGVVNQKLIAKEVSLWDELEEESGVKVPVFTLEEDKVLTWAQMLSGKGSIWTLGYVFKLNVTSVKKETGLFNLARGDLSAEQRVQAFRVTASPMARKLAGLLASAPVISLPIVRLIREALLRDSQQVHVAEVFLGGLLKPLSEINADTKPDYVQYEFMDGVRELLIDSVPSKYVLNVVDEVSKYVAKKAGLSLDNFAAVLRNPQQIRDSEIAGNISYFATVTADILRSLGGEYVKLANEIEIIRGDVLQLQEEVTEPLYEAKLLIVGEGGAGKTSLAKKIEDENYILKSDEDSTEGIDVIQWKFLLSNGKECSVNIWDFGGQEIYHQTQQFFFTKSSLYVLVVDSRRENTNFYWWLKIIALLSDNSPILIVKNEKQDRQCEVNERQLRAEFLNLKEVLAMNLDTNRGLAEIKQAIQYYIARLPHVGDASPLPKLWVRVRSAIENSSRNYISVHEYYQLCETNKLTDRKDMLRLSRYLHDIGVFLHYQDDSTLKHYLILKPEWATTAVYKVLENKTVIENLGCFSQEELADIWQDRKYNDMQDELLQLMMRFKICYQIPNRPGNYIAPQLLDINEPKYEWEKSNNLILRYKYEFMPKGIITRFIIETYPWIEQQKFAWKSGVVLNKHQTRAEIIENHNQREIKVRVSGNRKKELLTVVTHELEKIHRSFERLQYQTLVPCNCQKCVGSENPYSYPLDELHDFLKDGDYQIQCRKSRKMVDVHRLFEDVNLSPIENNKDNILQQQLESEKEISLNQNQPTIKYQDFQILVDKNHNIRASSEQGDVPGELCWEKNQIKLSLQLIDSQQTNSDLLKALGRQLYQALFPDKINARFQATIASAQGNQESVRLRLIFQSPELAALPWEFLYDEDTNIFLANNTETVLSRYIDVPLQKRDIKAANLPLKVLLVISTPTDLATLDIAGEEKLIREALGKHIETGEIELDVLQSATIGNINQKLREKPYNVFHFIGHGVFENNQGSIALVDTVGKSKLLDDQSFANFFLGNSNLGLVILNSCQGATVSSNQAFAGTAPNLVRRGIPAVVAMQYSILDNTAKLFADEFYRTLALGYPVDTAIQTTRNAISMEVGLDKRDFATPVLYMRAKDGIIFSGL